MISENLYLGLLCKGREVDAHEYRRQKLTLSGVEDLANEEPVFFPESLDGWAVVDEFALCNSVDGQAMAVFPLTVPIRVGAGTIVAFNAGSIFVSAQSFAAIKGAHPAIVA